jgi:predicted nucleic acid-binding protein
LSSIVLDASVTLAWCFPDEQSNSAVSILDQLQTGSQAVVPAFWSVEVLNTLLIGEKRKRITAEQTQDFLRDLRALAPIFDYAPLDRVHGIVQTICRDHLLTPYAALYVELALRSGYPLATLDHAQKEAAKSLGVSCLL